MKFRKYSAGQSSSVYYLLEADNWDDYGYRTTFKLSRVENDTPDRIGSVKIAKMGMPKASYNPIQVSDSRPEVPDTFEVLNDSFFSLGQETEYYINLQRYPGEREAVLKALRDIAFDPQIRSEVFQAFRCLVWVGWSGGGGWRVVWGYGYHVVVHRRLAVA